MLSGCNAVCGQCHTADSSGGAAAAEMAGLIRKLQRSLEQAAKTLARAQNDGMKVSGAIARQKEASQNLVKARSEVHAFDVASIAAPVNAGIALAIADVRAGEDALRERNVRREGLGVSLFGIGITVVGLWLAIRGLVTRRPAPLERRGTPIWRLRYLCSPRALPHSRMALAHALSPGMTTRPMRTPGNFVRPGVRSRLRTRWSVRTAKVPYQNSRGRRRWAVFHMRGYQLKLAACVSSRRPASRPADYPFICNAVSWIK